MQNYLLLIMLSIVFAGCSQDSENKKSENSVKTGKEVKKSAAKSEALVCLDEGDKITCKLVTKRVDRDREVEFEWESPNGKDDREREMVLPANHASIFDMRSKAGRAKGTWKVEVEIDDEEVSTSFEIR